MIPSNFHTFYNTCTMEYSSYVLCESHALFLLAVYTDYSTRAIHWNVSSYNQHHSLECEPAGSRLCFCWLFIQTTPPGLYTGISVAIINWNVNLLAQALFLLAVYTDCCKGYCIIIGID